MNKNKSTKLKTALSCTGFIALFLAILTLLSLLYVPKWRGLDAEEMRGLYQEEDNSIDILCLGSCNMYSSFSPVIAYEQHGLTSYVYACPDQELVISYHYLLEALKTQDIKLVVLESIFLTCEPTAKREYYNRTALEYMRPSLNKAELIMELGAMESEYMQTIDPSAPDKLLTYAGYFFPLLRYHGREDVTMKDVTFYSERDDYRTNKGGKPLFSYLTNETVDFDYVLNGEEVRETSREYFIKIQELCEEKGIQLLLVKSPNHYRWDAEATAAVTEFAKERNVDFVDFGLYDDFTLNDYSSTTGRLNIYGMKRFTEHLSDYVLENYDVAPHELSAENAAKWDECVEAFHERATKKKMTIDEGQIYRIYNEVSGIRLLWNRCLDGEKYTLYRKEGKNGTFEEIATLSECTYLDTDVIPGQGYTYQLVPQEGERKGIASEDAYYVFVDAPTNGSAENSNGTVYMTWDPSSVGTNYHIQRKRWSSLNYENWDNTSLTRYRNSSCDSCEAYNYRVRATLKEGEKTYYSGAVVVSAIPVTTPQITSVATKNNANTLRWTELSGGDTFEIYRRTEDEADFALYDSVSGKKTSYTDKKVENGVQYFYKIVLTKEKVGIESRSDDSNTVGIIAKVK